MQLNKEKDLIEKIEADITRLTNIIPSGNHVMILFEIARDLRDLSNMIVKKEKQEQNLER